MRDALAFTASSIVYPALNPGSARVDGQKGSATDGRDLILSLLLEVDGAAGYRIPSQLAVAALLSLLGNVLWANTVRSRLYAMKGRFHAHVGPWVKAFCKMLVDCERSNSEGGVEAVKSVFTNLRYVLVGIITETVDAKPRYLDAIPEDLWVMLCSWFFCFSGYNVYHGLFYRLVFNALRSNHPRSLEALLSKAHLVDELLDAYSTGEKDAGNRGFVLQLLNAIRLQAQTLSRWASLRVYLSSHEGWKAALPKLREDTLHKRPGMGFKVPVGRPKTQWQLGGQEDDGIDIGSRYAKTLGFDESGPWLRAMLMKGMAEPRKIEKGEKIVWEDPAKDRGTIKGRDEKSRWMGFRRSLVGM